MHAYVFPNRSRGFSLIEAMVGLAIAMIASLVITQVFTVFQSQKRSTTAGADAQTEAALAAYTIEREIRMAGYGLSIPEALGCRVNAVYNGNQRNFRLMPLEITSGASGAPDAIRVLFSAKKSWSAPARIITDHPPQATNMFLNSTQGIEVGDFLVGYQAGKDCTLLQVTGIPNGNVQIHHQSTSGWNPPGGQNIFPQPDGYTTGALLFNLGSLHDRRFALDAGSNLVYTDFLAQANTDQTRQAFSNIVSLQAQYGFDSRPGQQADGQVTEWSDAMVDADGSGTTGDSGDIRRMLAVRMAVVARSVARQAQQADGRCTTTTDTSPNRPAWMGGDIDVSRNPDGSANPQWQCYRYFVVESVIPLRNLLWKDS